MDSRRSLFSRKVFVGGLPFDATEDDIINTFSRFGPMTIDWPRRHSDDKTPINLDRRQTSGYVFLIYRNDASVLKILEACKVDAGRYFICMSTRNVHRKAVQVRPWRLSDYVYMPQPSALLNPRNTVFIGGVPRPTRAIDIVESVERRYGKVIYASIDIDPELRYPKGAARIVFATREGYVKAMTGRFLFLPHCGTNKRIDIKPYVIDEQMCSSCNGDRCQQRYASYFCAEPQCLQYYCEACWDLAHYKTINRDYDNHVPYVRSGDTVVKVYPVEQRQCRRGISPMVQLPYGNAVHVNRWPAVSCGRNFYPKK